MNIYTLSQVSVTHGGRRILDVDALSLERGLTYSLQGPNGAGKSTLLGILSFLSPPHDGEVRFEDTPVVWTETYLRPLRRQVGLVDQHPVMFSRSVRENVGFGLKMRGYSGKELDDRVLRALDRVGLAHMADTFAPRLSGGETQRVAIARALACETKILLLDEPTASVDAQHRSVIEQIVADLRDARETTIILCTHNRYQAWALCPNVIYLEDGRLATRPLTNSYACDFVEQDGHTWCRITDRFGVAAPFAATGRGRVVIEPERVKVAPVAQPGLNNGVVTQVQLEAGIVSMTVDLGLPLCVRLGMKDFQSLSACVGELVRVEISPESVDFCRKC